MKRLIKKIKYAAWFFGYSPEYTGRSLARLVFREHLLKRSIQYANDLLTWDDAVEKYGSDAAYCMLNRVVEM